MGLSIPIPAAFQSAAEIALNSQLKQAFEQRDPDLDAIQSYLKEATATNITLDVPGLEYAFRRRLEKEAEFFASKPSNLEMVQKLTTLLKFASTLPFPMVLWKCKTFPIAQSSPQWTNCARRHSPAMSRRKLSSTHWRNFAKVCGSMVNRRR